MKGYTVSVLFKVKPNKIVDMQHIIENVTVPSLAEAGMLEYRWYQRQEQSSEFLLFMTWASKQAFQDHVKTQHVQEAEEALKEILAADGVELYWEYLAIS